MHDLGEIQRQTRRYRHVPHTHGAQRDAEPSAICTCAAEPYSWRMRWIHWSELSRSNLHREMLFGRLGMIATFGILIVRELPGFRFLDFNTQLVLALGIVLGGLVWTWFWLDLAARPDRPAHGAAVALMVVAATTIVLARPLGIFPFYYAVIVAGAAYSWRIGAILAAAVTIWTTVVWWQMGMVEPRALSGIVITILLGGAAVIIRRYVGVHLELYETREELRRMATIEARRQLAIDLHDQLGQSLTATVMQGELLLMDLPDDSPDDVRSRAHVIVNSSRESLTLMRGMVSEIRKPDLRSEVLVSQQLLEISGLNCEATLACEDLPPETDAAFGWIVREATTNVLRHSDAQTCTITVDLRDGAHVLRVCDDGRGAETATPGNGYASMAERVRTVGGSLHFATEPGRGLSVTAAVPTS